MLVGLAVLLLPKVLFSTLCGRGVGLRADGGGVKRQARRRRRNACCRSALRQTLNGARNFMARVPGEMELLHRHVAAQQERRPAAHRRRLALVGFGSNDVGDGVVTAAADGSARAARSSSGHVAGTWDGGLHGELRVPMRTVAVDARELFASPTSLGPAGGGVGVDARSGSDSGGRNDARAASSAAPASGSAERGPHTSGGSGRKDQGLAGEERLGPGWVAGWGAPLGTTLSSGSTFQITIQPARHTLKNVCQ
jgi:hypothetical protein